MAPGRLTCSVVLGRPRLLWAGGSRPVELSLGDISRVREMIRAAWMGFGRVPLWSLADVLYVYCKITVHSRYIQQVTGTRMFLDTVPQGVYENSSETLSCYGSRDKIVK